MRRLILFFLILALLAGGGFAASRYLGNADRTSRHDDVPSYTIESRDLTSRVEAIGIVVARESVMVSAPFSGELVKLVPEGTFVEKGDPVAWIDGTELEERVETSALELAQAESEYERAVEEKRLLEVQQTLDLEAERARVNFNELQVEDAKRKYEEQRQLVEKNLASQNSLEDQRLEVLSAELTLRESKIDLRRTEERQQSDLRVKDVEIERAKVNVDRRQKDLDETERKLERRIMTAPAAGFVSVLYTWRGQRAKIAEGDEVREGRGVVEIPDSDQMIAAVPINELDINKIEVGQPAEVRVAALPDEVFRGVVSKKGSVPLSAEGGREYPMMRDGIKMFEVEIDFEVQDERFRQNMTAYMTIQTGHKPQVAAVPFEAVFRQKGDEEAAATVAETPAAPMQQFGGGGPGMGGGGGGGMRGGGGQRGGGGMPGMGGGPPMGGGGPRPAMQAANRHGWFVLLREPNGDVRQVPVRLGIDDGNYVELLAKEGEGGPVGIEPGAELLLRDPAQPIPRF